MSDEINKVDVGEEFVCKVRFKKGALDDLEVIEGDERRCRELFRSNKSLNQ